MRKTHFWKSDGVITLIATLLGVFLALYLNEWNASRKLKKQKEIATENILLEISSNKEKLTESVKNHIEMFETFSFFIDNFDDDENIITSIEKMAQFRTNHPNIINIRDSVKLDNGNYKYTGLDLNFNFMLDQMELRTIAWETLKSSDIGSTYSFNNLMSLELLYKGINNSTQRNKEILDTLITLMDNNMNGLRKLIINLKITIDLENSLIDLCNEDYEKLKNCG